MSLLLEPLQNAVASEITTAPEIENVPVVAFKAGDLTSLINRNIQHTQGQCIVVMPPYPTRMADCPGLAFERARLTVRLASYLHHDSGMPALLSLAESISQLLHDWSPRLAYWHGRMKLETDNPWEVILAERGPDPHRIDIHFTLFGNLLPGS